MSRGWALLCIALAQAAAAQNYPNKPIRFVVGFAPGGATEAEESGAELENIQAALTHSKKETTLRYIRQRGTKIAAVAEARSRKRAADQGDGTG